MSEESVKVSDTSKGGSCSANSAKKADEKRELQENISRIKNRIVVLSGKGGVGKSTVAVNLAVSLARRGFMTGLLDIDIHGPSVPKMLGLEGSELLTDGSGKQLLPVAYSGNLRVISVGLLLEKSDQAIIWRGPLKYGVIKQFLKDVAWGELDYLVIDSPPGTGDEPLSICQLMDKGLKAVVVTTPQDVAILDVRKSITFCNTLSMDIIGVVENMSGFTCPHCNKQVDLFGKGGGKKMSEELGVPFLGSIPIDVEMPDKGDAGKPVVEDESGRESVMAINEIVNKIIG